MPAIQAGMTAARMPITVASRARVSRDSLIGLRSLPHSRNRSATAAIRGRAGAGALALAGTRQPVAGRCDAANRIATDARAVQRVGMLAARDLCQQPRGAIQLAGLGE